MRSRWLGGWVGEAAWKERGRGGKGDERAKLTRRLLLFRAGFLGLEEIGICHSVGYRVGFASPSEETSAGGSPRGDEGCCEFSFFFLLSLSFRIRWDSEPTLTSSIVLLSYFFAAAES